MVDLRAEPVQSVVHFVTYTLQLPLGETETLVIVCLSSSIETHPGLCSYITLEYLISHLCVIIIQQLQPRSRHPLPPPGAIHPHSLRALTLDRPPSHLLPAHHPEHPQTWCCGPTPSRCSSTTTARGRYGRPYTPRPGPAPARAALSWPPVPTGRLPCRRTGTAGYGDGRTARRPRAATT